MTQDQPPATPEYITITDDLASLGLTPPTWQWQKGQRELAEQIANSPKKIVMLEAECGTGKSLIPIAAATALKKKAIVLIQTIQLQEQYLRDIRGLSMMMGRSHAICNLTEQPADTAPCVIGTKCSLRGAWTRSGDPIGIPECNYFKRKAAAKLSNISIQNYAYWLGETQGDGSVFNKSDWIICDEGHELDTLLMGAATITLRARDFRELEISLQPIMRQPTMAKVREWARSDTVRNQLDNFWQQVLDEAERLGIDWDESDIDGRERFDIKPSMYQTQQRIVSLFVQSVQAFRRVEAAMNTIGALKDDELDEWVLCPPDRSEREWTVRPIYGKYGFKRILNAAREKVVIMSAFLAPEMLMHTLGLGPDDVDIIYAPKAFDRTKSPIFYTPVIKVAYKNSQQERNYLAAVVSEIMDAFPTSKGLIHVPSVAMRDDLTRRVRNKRRLLTYDGYNASADSMRKDEALSIFTKTEEPLVLVGQSISTGVDLPYVPQWQIITKLAFPPITDPAIAKRKEVDKFFYPYQTICQLVQACGRVKRKPDHDGPTYILDEQFRWFWAAYNKHFPAWFRDNLVYQGWGRMPSLQRRLRSIAMENGVLLPTGS